MTIVISVSTSSILPDVAAAFNASSILQDVAALNAWCIPKDSCRQDKVITAPMKLLKKMSLINSLTN